MNKKILFLFLLTFVLLSVGYPAYALEVTYPKIPGLPNLNEGSNIGQYISYFFGAAIYVAGIISLISFTIGAILLMFSSENPTGAGDAKDRMKGALLGLVLTMASFIILRTINQNFITPILYPLPGVEGIYLTDGSKKISVSSEVPDVATLDPNYPLLEYTCTDSSKAPALLLWEFPKVGLEPGNGDLSKVTVERISCGGQTDIDYLGSFRMAFESTGIYYFLGSGCTGYASLANTSSQDTIVGPFAGKIKSIQINNNAKENLYYGAIFHGSQNLSSGGACTLPITGDGCQSVTIAANSADIFNINTDPKSSGSGVDFYSEPHGQDSGSRAGYYKINKEAFTKTELRLSADSMNYSYNNVDATEDYKQECKTFYDCPKGSIDIKGDYLVGLYSQNIDGKAGLFYCQTFTKDRHAENLNVESIIAAGGDDISQVTILPIK